MSPPHRGQYLQYLNGRTSPPAKRAFDHTHAFAESPSEQQVSKRMKPQDMARLQSSTTHHAGHVAMRNQQNQGERFFPEMSPGLTLSNETTPDLQQLNSPFTPDNSHSEFHQPLGPPIQFDQIWALPKGAPDYTNLVSLVSDNATAGSQNYATADSATQMGIFPQPSYGSHISLPQDSSTFLPNQFSVPSDLQNSPNPSFNTQFGSQDFGMPQGQMYQSFLPDIPPADQQLTHGQFHQPQAPSSSGENRAYLTSQSMGPQTVDAQDVNLTTNLPPHDAPLQQFAPARHLRDTQTPRQRFVQVQQQNVVYSPLQGFGHVDLGGAGLSHSLGTVHGHQQIFVPPVGQEMIQLPLQSFVQDPGQGSYQTPIQEMSDVRGHALIQSQLQEMYEAQRMAQVQGQQIGGVSRQKMVRNRAQHNFHATGLTQMPVNVEGQTPQDQQAQVHWNDQTLVQANQHFLGQLDGQASIQSTCSNTVWVNTTQHQPRFVEAVMNKAQAKNRISGQARAQGQSRLNRAPRRAVTRRSPPKVLAQQPKTKLGHGSNSSTKETFHWLEGKIPQARRSALPSDQKFDIAYPKSRDRLLEEAARARAKQYDSPCPSLPVRGLPAAPFQSPYIQNATVLKDDLPRLAGEDAFFALGGAHMFPMNGNAVGFGSNPDIPTESVMNDGLLAAPALSRAAHTNDGELNTALELLPLAVGEYLPVPMSRVEALGAASFASLQEISIVTIDKFENMVTETSARPKKDSTLPAENSDVVPAVEGSDAPENSMAPDSQHNIAAIALHQSSPAPEHEIDDLRSLFSSPLNEPFPAAAASPCSSSPAAESESDELEALFNTAYDEMTEPSTPKEEPAPPVMTPAVPAPAPTPQPPPQDEEDCSMAQEFEDQDSWQHAFDLLNSDNPFSTFHEEENDA